MLPLSPPLLNLGTYLAGAGAGAAAAAAGAITGSRAGDVIGAALVARAASAPLRRASFLCLSFSSNSLSLCCCLAAIASSLAFLSASSLFLFSSSARNIKYSN
jgi:hypothetical protein